MTRVEDSVSRFRSDLIDEDDQVREGVTCERSWSERDGELPRAGLMACPPGPVPLLRHCRTTTPHVTLPHALANLGNVSERRSIEGTNGSVLL